MRDILSALLPFWIIGVPLAFAVFELMRREPPGVPERRHYTTTRNDVVTADGA